MTSTHWIDQSNFSLNAIFGVLIGRYNIYLIKILVIIVLNLRFLKNSEIFNQMDLM